LSISTLHNEKELLMLAAQGDEAAFTRLFYAYHNRLGAYIMRLTSSREIAEEIVQDVFTKVWTRRETLHTIENFGSYIYVLSRNRTLNCLRQLAKERIRNSEVVESIKRLYSLNDPADAEPDYYDLIDKAVEALPPQQQKVYILSRREHLRYEEIAGRMNISRETVKKYLKIATRAITSYVRTHGDLLIVFLLIHHPY